MLQKPTTMGDVNQKPIFGTSDPALPQRVIHLTQAQAGTWLCCLEQIHASSQPCQSGKSTFPNLTQLQDSLYEACWLARWKRENVILELCKSMLPGLIEELLALSQLDHAKQDFDTLEQMIFAIVRDQHAEGGQPSNCVAKVGP